MSILSPLPPPTADELPPSDVDPSDPGMATTVYEHTRSGMPRLRPYMADVWQRRPFIWHLARTKLKAENYDTLAGQVWIILNPLFMALVYLMVRSIFRPPSEGEDVKAVLDQLVMGVFFFRFASSALTNGANSITTNSQMVLNTGFPRIVFPLASTVQATMEFLPTLVVYFLVHAYLGQPFTHAIAYVPAFIFTLMVLNLGLSLLFAPLHVLYTDIKRLTPNLTRVWFFATPVMYSVALIETNAPELLPVLKINPLFPWFDALQDIFGGVTPPVTDLLWSACWAGAFLALGTFVFLRKEQYFARRL